MPTPLKVLGHIVGAPDILDHSADIYKYFRALAAATPRVQAWTVGPTDEGREMIAVAVTSEENMTRLARLKEIMARLADPRGLKDEDAAKLVAEGLPVYWITGGMHSTECGSPEMMMELAYRLAVENSEAVEAIRRNLVVLMTPIIEVDGWDKAVDSYLFKKDSKDKKTIPPIYWGKYVLHDNNRDGIGLGLKLTENLLKAYFEWHPIIMHDLHESVPYLYISTGTGPYNAWLDPITINEWQELADNEVSGMNRRGVPGVWTHGFYDGWAANYGFFVALFHNSVGRFYETFGGTGADTMVRTVGAESKRAWFRQNPPLESVKWSFRNNTNMMESALLLSFGHVAAAKAKFLDNFYVKSRRAVAKARTEGPAAYVIPSDTTRPLAAARLVEPPPQGRRRGPRGQRRDRPRQGQVPGRELRHPHGPALQPLRRHAPRHAVLQPQGPAPLRRHRLDARAALQRPDRPRHRRQDPRRPHDHPEDGRGVRGPGRRQGEGRRLRRQ